MIEEKEMFIRCTLEAVKNRATSTEAGASWLQIAHLWPLINLATCLRELESAEKASYPELGTSNAIISLGMAITELQRLRRIALAYRKNDSKQVLEEWSYTGHRNWDPHQYPSWLLLEIDNDLLIREEQIDVAHAIISPCSNSLVQLNMGKGEYF